MRAAVLGWAQRAPVPAIDAFGRAVLRIPSDPKPSRHARYLRRMGLFGMEVAAEALAQSAVPTGDRLALFAGVGGLRAHWDDMMPALQHQRDDADGSWDRGLKDIHPHWLLRHLSNNAHALLAKDLGARGEGATFGGANGSAQALAAAIRTLAVGAADAAVVVAYDSLLDPETLVLRSVEQVPGIPGESAAAIVLATSGPARGYVSAFAGIADSGRVDAAFGAAATLVQTIFALEAFANGTLTCGAVESFAIGPPKLIGQVRVERA